ncbi:MAG: BadF/BadG/BcrA/BcrD ATPase family protein [Planctomycetota bacterium]
MASPTEPLTIVLGIDAGGTKSRALVAQRGLDGRFCVLGSGLAGPGNPLGCGVQQAAEAIGQAASQAIEQARHAVGDPRIEPNAALVAVAGAADPVTRQRLTEALQRHPALGRCTVTPDYAPLFCLAPDGEPAIALIAGTGATALARDSDGQVWRAGGWGYLLGDDGSGFALGRAAVRQALADRDSGVEASPLTRALCEGLGVDDPADLTATVYRSSDSRHALAALARIVCEAAETDTAAQSLVQSEAKALAGHAAGACRAAGIERSPASLVFAGTLAIANRVFREAVTQSLVASGTSLAACHLAHDPAELTLQLACRPSDG